MVINILKMIVPIGAAAMLFSIIFNGVQTRFRFTFSLLKPKFSRINPLNELKKVFSLKSLVELLKSIIKLIVIIFVVYTEISSNMEKMINMPLARLEETIVWVAKIVYNTIIKISVIMLIFGAADYLYQWWSYEREIMMTKQEVKDEYKRLEGDPHIRGRIKEIQRKMSLMRMMHKVPSADVVIKNPTHYAVALKYEPKKDIAPVVIAKGKDHVALKIIEIAEKNNVYITENRPLARGLYEAVDINQRIPEEFYKAVAEIIAFIYKLKKTKTQR